MRKKMIAGNWKMNYTINQGEDFIYSIIDSINTDEVDVVICPNFTLLDRFSDIFEEKRVSLGAQNVYFEESGAFTGEVSAPMLKALNVKYCIVGHSERRTIFNETDDMVNKKVKALISNDIIPIICVGEKLEERNNSSMFDIVERQIKGALKDIDDNNVRKNIVIAYEPIWAIGTGVTATADEAEEMCKFIRKTVGNMFSSSAAESVRILYGGSVNPKNASEILSKENIDGALVGGASLKNDFISIVNFE